MEYTRIIHLSDRRSHLHCWRKEQGNSLDRRLLQYEGETGETGEMQVGIEWLARKGRSSRRAIHVSVSPAYRERARAYLQVH
jgi:hypothetical protein